jgi:hypothetical protein
VQHAAGVDRVVSKHIGTRDLVQEYLANRVFPTLKEWNMPKLKGEKEKEWTCSTALSLQVQETFQRALPRMVGND